MDGAKHVKIVLRDEMWVIPWNKHAMSKVSPASILKSSEVMVSLCRFMKGTIVVLATSSNIVAGVDPKNIMDKDVREERNRSGKINVGMCAR